MQPASAIVSEELLEKTLVSHPQLLMPGLRLVGRQTPTEGGPLDLLGVDEGGRLVVFELKRGTLSRDAVAQVIDYASYLDSLDDDSLSQHIAGYSGHGGIDKIDDFGEWYSENIQGDGLESLRPVRMYLVGLGVDDRTERMVNFLAKSSRMDISLLTFYGYNYGDKTLLARQVRVSEPEPVKPTTGVVELAKATECMVCSSMCGKQLSTTGQGNTTTFRIARPARTWVRTPVPNQEDWCLTAMDVLSPGKMA